MKITSSIEYAMRIMVRLAALDQGATLNAETLSDIENIPRDYVDQILLRLRRSGLVLSRRGVLGGYSLAKSPSAISIGSVVEAVERSIFEPVCEKYAHGAQTCAHTTGSCGIRPIWQRLSALIEEFLHQVTLAELCQEEYGVQSRITALFGELKPPKNSLESREAH
jgi:Rrf2 family iron-sulfur cluster assembly transcriptional regulator